MNLNLILNINKMKLKLILNILPGVELIELNQLIITLCQSVLNHELLSSQYLQKKNQYKP